MNPSPSGDSVHPAEAEGAASGKESCRWKCADCSEWAIGEAAMVQRANEECFVVNGQSHKWIAMYDEPPVEIQGALANCDACGLQIAAGSDQMKEFVMQAAGHHDRTGHYMRVRVVHA